MIDLAPGMAYVVRGDNSVKSIPLSSYTLSERTGLPLDAAVSAQTIYNTVPAVYRCISLRAQAVSRVPFEVEPDGKGRYKADRDEVARWIRRWLYNIEASLCQDGGAYLMFEHNKVKALGLKWLAFPTVTPVYDSAAGVRRFDRDIGAGKPQELAVEDVVHIWLPDPNVEVGPGRAPAEVALKPALTVMRANEYVEQFFERGGMNVTLLITDPATPDSDLKRLETWWKKLTRGVKRAWEAIALRKNVDVKQFGYPLDQLAMPDLKAQALREIANAFGVPEYYLSSDVANFATAKSYDLTFNADIITAEVGLIEAALNDQLLSQLGLRLTFHPERLEVFQEAELSKAEGLSKLTGEAAIYSLNEARAMMELKPVPGGDWADQAAREEAARQAQAQAQAQAAQAPMPMTETPMTETPLRALLDEVRAARQDVAAAVKAVSDADPD